MEIRKPTPSTMPCVQGFDGGSQPYCLLPRDDFNLSMDDAYAYTVALRATFVGNAMALGVKLEALGRVIKSAVMEVAIWT